jgi:uroporphyrin-III C-methyltransferase / precorrin-2 dehydrogenase / sirohydrochlorin ferrochelatase
VTSEPVLFPIFLKLAGVPVLMVGAGPVAASKLEALLPTGADITVVAPDICEAVRASGVRLVQRPFEERDLDRAWLVFSAATPEVNAAVSRAAAARRLFVNAVDDPPNATAYLGGVVRRSGATIAISTSGRSPALAGLLREGIDELLPGDAQIDAWFEASDDLKRRWRSTGVPMAERRPELAQVIARRYCGTMPSCRERRGDVS